MPRDPFAEGLFPLCVATHDHGVRQLFDLATLLLLLDCRPGDRVLDVGAGAGFSSEMLARLGYDVVAIDPDHAALLNNVRRREFDKARIDGQVTVVEALAERLPFIDQAFDGLIGMNVLHHVPDLSAALCEFARLLRPGRHAVFCEPGLEHLHDRVTQRAMTELGETDRPFDVMAFLRTARSKGFANAMLTATLQPPLRLLPIEEVDTYLSGHHPRAALTPQGVIEELQKRHAYALIVRAGVRRKTSQHPGLLRAEIEVTGLPLKAPAGAMVTAAARIKNTGDTIWLATPNERGGYVTLGCKLLTSESRLISDQLPRTFLPNDLPPGSAVTLAASVQLPDALTPGRYVLRFDLVDELICWFSDVGQSAINQPLEIV